MQKKLKRTCKELKRRFAHSHIRLDCEYSHIPISSCKSYTICTLQPLDERAIPSNIGVPNRILASCQCCAAYLGRDGNAIWQWSASCNVGLRLRRNGGSSLSARLASLCMSWSAICRLRMKPLLVLQVCQHSKA